MIVFNISALLQAIILAVVIVFFTWTGFGGWLGNLLSLTAKAQMMAAFYFLYWIVATTYRNGMKGKIFWIPTWVLALAFIWIYGISATDWDATPGFLNSVFKTLCFFLPVFLAFRMIKKQDNMFRAQFEHARIALSSLNKTDDAFEANKANFWAGISHAFVWPTTSFRYAYPIYRKINPEGVTYKDFNEHYAALAQAIKPRVVRPENNPRIDQAASAFNYAVLHRVEKDRGFGLKEIAKVIDSENEIWNRK